MPRTRSHVVKNADPAWERILRLPSRIYFSEAASAKDFCAKHLSGWKRVEFEIGAGSGDFLVTAAARQPETLFVGIEYSARFLKLCRDRITSAGLKNVLLICTDARLFLERLLPEASIDGIHVYFPDPWPKRAQQKRRFLSTWRLKEVSRVLKVGGKLYFSTDFPGYWEAVMEDASALKDLKIVDKREIVGSLEEASAFYAAYEARTHYGEKHLRAGKKLFACLLEKALEREAAAA